MSDLLCHEMSIGPSSTEQERFGLRHHIESRSVFLEKIMNTRQAKIRIGEKTSRCIAALESNRDSSLEAIHSFNEIIRDCFQIAYVVV